ncbi:DUF4349 domain-containing protein [Streptomyces sp. NPDC005925]|uniref:DUF4349 domain-containing protein n=1 Tax=Streptomyces sp. NPDC005925 TaxID=3157172 RepID=UPI0033D03894
MHTRSSARPSARPVLALAGLLLAAGLALTGCGGSGDGDASSSADYAKSGAEGGSQGGAKEGAAGSGRADGDRASAAPQAPAHPDRVIRTASVSVRVKDVPKALAEARAATEDAGGYVGDETTTADENGHERTRVVLRVPVDRYEAVLADLEGAGRLLERTAKAQDVTDQIVDAESRIASQRASVARIRELMDRATKLSDVVTLEGELSARQADLESLLARQASLKDRTSLATITLSLSERPVPADAAKDDDPDFVDALTGGWDAFVTMLRWLLVVLGAVLPFAAAAALLVLAWLRLVRPRLPRRPAPASTATAPGPLPSARTAPGRARAGSPDEPAAREAHEED